MTRRQFIEIVIAFLATLLVPFWFKKQGAKITEWNFQTHPKSPPSPPTILVWNRDSTWRSRMWVTDGKNRVWFGENGVWKRVAKAGDYS